MFNPYEITHLNGCRFLVGNAEGKAWYDPINPFAQLEYDWVLENIEIKGKRVVDVGAHHGHYALLFKDAAELVCIEPVGDNASILKHNLEINGIQATIKLYVIAHGNLQAVAGEMDIVKMDIEGAEFAALPAAIDDMPTVKDWIVELHPTRGRPETIIQAFIERGFEVHYVNRQTAQVEPDQPGTVWKSHATVIARRK